MPIIFDDENDLEELLRLPKNTRKEHILRKIKNKKKELKTEIEKISNNEIMIIARNIAINCEANHIIIKNCIKLAEKDYFLFEMLIKSYGMALIEKKNPPEFFTEWVANVLVGNTQCPKKRGPKKYKNMARNKIFCFAIEETKKLGFDPTRNIATNHTETGCDIIAEAFYYSYDQIVAIWNDRDIYSKWWLPPKVVRKIRVRDN
jgi:hypothetical protein